MSNLIEITEAIVIIVVASIGLSFAWVFVCYIVENVNNHNSFLTFINEKGLPIEKMTKVFPFFVVLIFILYRASSL
ncbi:hypothetical protein [Chamaesiphon sp.]|uniref:hypothetical protein n=1 Tax=Chamaesiphon sp. TaxID=2814140 RepID=UPI003593258F